MSDVEVTANYLDSVMVERLFTLHPPKDAEVEKRMNELRARFKDLALVVLAQVPRTPDRTIAIRSIHRACMDTIAAVACNQGE
jgi:hypothetical protein